MVKKLTALLLCALFTGAALAETAADKAADVTETKATKKSGRYNRQNRRNKDENKGEYSTTTVTDEIVNRRHVHGNRYYEGGSCSTGSCGVRRSHEHASCNKCQDKGNCGHCYRKEAQLPPKPCCEKAVTVRTEPCLHKQTEITYNWTCPVDYTETACPSC